MSAKQIEKERQVQDRIAQEMKRLRELQKRSALVEREAERRLDRDQCILLGRAQKQDLARNPKLAALVVSRMDKLCTRDKDREKFGLPEPGGSLAETKLDWVSDNPEFQTRVRAELSAAASRPREAPASPGAGSAAAPASPRPSPTAAPDASASSKEA